MRMRITTPLNPEYSGQTFGIQFNQGVAIVDGPANKLTRYGVSYANLPEEFRKMNGYEVEVMEDRTTELPSMARPAVSERPTPERPQAPKR